MIFAIYCRFNPEKKHLREPLLSEHRGYLRLFSESFSFAGPLLDDAGQFCGSLIVMEFDKISDAAEWINNEPFNKNGLFAKVEISEFRNLWDQKTGFPAVS